MGTITLRFAEKPTADDGYLRAFVLVTTAWETVPCRCPARIEAWSGADGLPGLWLMRAFLLGMPIARFGRRAGYAWMLKPVSPLGCARPPHRHVCTVYRWRWCRGSRVSNCYALITEGVTSPVKSSIKPCFEPARPVATLRYKWASG